MSVKIFIKRKINNDNMAELTVLLKKLRTLTLEQPGYISGETLARIDKKDECMVISTWRSVEDWNKWVNSPKRNEVQAEIDRILGQDTDYAIYSS
ncbi:antibiotic biosynthesis monooxygenase family protein [Desulforhopalus singaporensis]|uniref:Heme-degrading monooxygenase HmoA n=1 Tax=Desulforhopalus singaporensis TaxID=91360 RepID=A0A1H0MK67_9BACT|nr:antibiotic biosynthesis monooxygenase [Desulforhopalus singaporensis]SDO80666.1 Heme-degrading monooxygenase HmoA [Desulforhopalus singaporensis]